MAYAGKFLYMISPWWSPTAIQKAISIQQAHWDVLNITMSNEYDMTFKIKQNSKTQQGYP